MIYIITNNKKHSEGTLYFVKAPGFDMPMYLQVVNGKQIAACPAPADVCEERCGRLEILATTGEIHWSDLDWQADMEMDIENFQTAADVEGRLKAKGVALENLSRYKTIVIHGDK